MLGVVKLVPLAKLVPPVATSYQLMVPALEAAIKFTVPVPQRLAGVLEVILGTAFTVTLTLVDESLQLLEFVTTTL